jgi:hypothetical protein
MFSKSVMSVITIIFTIVVGLSSASASQKAMTDTQVKKAIIRESIAGYPGNCPCPYNAASNGSRCGRRSAYSRPGGYAPICYESDVPQGMIKEWRESRATH